MTKRRTPLTKAQLLAGNPVFRANQQRPVDEKTKRKLLLQARLAFDNIMAGRTQPSDPDDLAAAMNVSLMLCEMGIGREYESAALAAQDALIAAQHREDAGHAYAFTEPELQAVVTLLELHEAHLEAASQIELIEAIARVDARGAAGHTVRLERKTER